MAFRNSRCAQPAPAEDQRLIRTLLALPELGMRVSWLQEQILAGHLELVAQAFDRIAQRSQSASSSAKEALLCVAIVVSQLSESSWHFALCMAARKHHLINLERLLRTPPDGATPEMSVGARDDKVPDFGLGRELTVGERRAMARRPTRTQLEKLLLDPHPLVLEQLFACPYLTEKDIITVVTRRPPSPDALRLLVRSPRWIARRRVRLSLIMNPGAPLGLALPFVATCPREDLRLISSTTTVNQHVRTVAHELYRLLPPVPPSARHSLKH